MGEMSGVEISVLLNKLSSGNQDAREELIGAVYLELRRMAASFMRRERQNHTLQPTALVNEAYIRLLQGDTTWENKAHFFGAAARAMRRILIEHARQKRSEKHGGSAQRVTFADIDVQAEDPQINLLSLDEALTALGDVDPRLVEVVELRYFAGCDLQETSRILGVSAATVKRDWTYARAWLYDFMSR